MPADAVAMSEVDRQSWPTSLATSVEGFRSRIEAFPSGQLVADSDGRIVGAAGAQRVTRAFFNAHIRDYDLVTDSDRFTASHDSHGEIYQLIGVGVAPEFRGGRLGRQLVDRQIAYARSLAGIERIMGFTRPAGFRKHQQLSIDQYVALRDSNGRHVDPVLSFHVSAGAQILSVHPGFRPNDEQSGGYGVLIEYALYDDVT
jgi:GNAT superfamily N-acetyltransferase